MLVPWTTLQPSQQARRWRRVAFGIAAASSIALLTAAFASASFSAGLAALAVAAGVAAWTGSRWKRASIPLEIGVSPVGEIWLRQCDQTHESVKPPLRVVFAAPWLISLRRGSMLIPIWPDCLPPAVFRQLWVHLHWGRAGRSDNEQQQHR